MSLAAAVNSRATAPGHAMLGFDACVGEWRALLRQHVGPVDALRWVLRENLRVGNGEGDPSISIHFQCIEPELSPRDVARVFERERAAGRPVHLELVAALPEALVVSLRRGPTWARHRDGGRGVTMQTEPSFHSFVEVDSIEEWRSLREGPERKGAIEILDGVLPARTTTAPTP